MRGTKKVNHLLGKSLGVNIKRTNKTPQHNRKPVIGMVERFDRNKIAGWVSASQDRFPIKVTLCINGFPVVSTYPEVKSERTTLGEIRSFYIATHDIWDYCKRKYKLTVQIDKQVLPMYEKGVYRRPGKSGEKNLADLKELLSKGYVFDNFGKLQLSKKLDTKWQKRIMDIYNEVSKILDQEYSITPFLIYGSLLGQVREGGFIGHDGDFDIAYISKYKRGDKVVEEMESISRSLIDAGFDIYLHPTSIHIHSRGDYKLKIDLFHLFFDRSNSLQFPFGVAGTTVYTTDDWHGTKQATFSGYPAIIPNDPEILVRHLYGDSWRIPISGFNWHHARTSRSRTGYIPRETLDKINQLNKSKTRTNI